MTVDQSVPVADRTSPSARGWAGRLVLAVAIWALLCAAVVGVGWLLVHPLAGSVGRFDNDLARWIAGHRTPALDDLAVLGSLAGKTVVGQVVMVTAAVVLSLWQRSLRPALFLALLGGGLLGIYSVATNLVPRPRPPVHILDPGLVFMASFPSGHTATATATYGCLVVLAWVYLRRIWRWTLPLLVVPFLVLASRLYQGAHHLTDVATSVTYATAWLLVLTALVLRPGLDET